MLLDHPRRCIPHFVKQGGEQFCFQISVFVSRKLGKRIAHLKAQGEVDNAEMHAVNLSIMVMYNLNKIKMLQWNMQL